MSEQKRQNFLHRVRVSRAVMRPRRARAKLPRKVPPKTVALAYYRRIAAVLEQARVELERELAPLLPELAREAQAAQREDSARTDARKLNEILDAVGRRFFDNLRPTEIEALAEDFARKTAAWEREQSAKQVRAAFGVDVLAQEPKLAARTSAFVAENVALIKSIPSQFFDDVEKRVARAVSSGATPKQLAAEIAKAHGIADDRAMLIARDQIGKFHGQVAQARQTAMGVTHYIWRTSNDERVRDEHAAREGERFAWDDPPDGGHPGEDFQCRCISEPLLDELLEGARGQEKPEPEIFVEVLRPEPKPKPEERDAEDELRRAHAEEIERRTAEQERIRRERERALLERAAEAEAARLVAETEARARTLPNVDTSAIAPEARQRFEAEASKVIGRPVTLEEIMRAYTPEGMRAEVVEVGGKLGETRLKIHLYNDKGQRVTSDRGMIRSLERDKDGNLIVHHAFVKFDERFQDAGLSRKLMSTALDAYEKLGVSAIELEASYVGRYTWATYGFRFKNPDEMLSAFEDYVDRVGSKWTEEERRAAIEEARRTVDEPWKFAAMDNGKKLPDEQNEKPVAGGFPLGKAFLLSKDGPPWEGRLVLDPADPGYKIAKGKASK